MRTSEKCGKPSSVPGSAGRLAGCLVSGMCCGLVVGRLGEPAVVAGPAGGSALTIHVVAALAMSSLRFPLAVDTTAGRGGMTDGKAGRAGSARSAQQPASQPAALGSGYNI